MRNIKLATVIINIKINKIIDVNIIAVKIADDIGMPATLFDSDRILDVLP